MLLFSLLYMSLAPKHRVLCDKIDPTKSYVSGEIHTSQCYCTVFTTLRCHCLLNIVFCVIH